MKKKIGLGLFLVFLLAFSFVALTGQPTFLVRLLDTNYTHYLILKWNEDRAANQTLNFVTGAADRTVTLSGNLTVELNSLINQDLTTDSATATLAGLALTGNLTLAANSITGTSVDINNAEMQQLSLIGATTISAAQWGYLGAMNQGVGTGNTVEFAVITEGGNAVPNATDNLSFFSATTSAQLAGVISNETGSGALMFGTSPTITTSLIMSDGATVGQAAGPLLTFDDSNNLLEYTGGNLLVGTSANITTVGDNFIFQVAADGADAGGVIARFTADSAPPFFGFLKSRNATIGSNTIVNDDDELGRIQFVAADGNDFNSYSAVIQAFVDGTPGVNDTPGRLVFGTTADGAASPTARLYLLSDGGLGLNTATVPHGGVGYAKFAIDGTNASSAGPHIQITTSSDDYPLLQFYSWTHDEINILFDAYKDAGGWKSSDAGSNYNIHKVTDLFKIRYDSGIAQGGVVTWNDGIVLNTSGQVGIGTASQNYQLELLLANGGDLSLKTTDTTVTAGTILGTIHFAGSDSELTAGGLGAYITGRAEGTWNSSDADAGTGLNFHVQSNGDVDNIGTASMTITSSGDVGIAETGPDSKLEVNGTIHATNLDGGAINLTANAAGQIIRDPSDKKFKKNIKPIENALDMVMGLQGVSFDWTEEINMGDGRAYGYVANDAELVVPELVSGVDSKGFRYTNFTAILGEAIKEQQGQIETLEDRIAQLENLLLKDDK